jgi:cytosine/adenosine deaminase-related metal-dependent hydrolase
MPGETIRTLTVGRVFAAPGREAPLGPCRIRIADGRIAVIDPIAAEALDPGTGGLVALPTPSNAHDHGRGLRTAAFGAADDDLEIWLPALAREPVVDPYLRAAVGFARMVEGGIAATNHCHNTQDRRQLLAEAEGVSRAARDIGIRVAFAVPFAGRNPIVYGELDDLVARLDPEDAAALLGRVGTPRSLAETMALVEEIAALEHEFFTVQYGPVGPQWLGDEAMAAIARASAETGRRVHLHLFETRRQREWADAHYEGGLIRELDRIGLLTERLTVAHAVWLTEEECALLAARGVSASVNISSNLRLRSGRPIVDRLRATGLGFGIGLDGMSFDDDEDMLREIRLVWRHYRGFGGDEGLDEAELFEAANLVGRRTILGKDGGGQLAVGAPADLLLLDLDEITRDCVHDDHDVLDLLLTRMTKRHIRQSIIGGRLAFDAGACAGVDRPALERALTEDARRALAAAPPDTARIARLQQAVDGFYRCGCHTKRAPKEA